MPLAPPVTTATPDTIDIFPVYFTLTAEINPFLVPQQHGTNNPGS